MRLPSGMLRPSLSWLLVFVPISLVAEFAHQSLVIFTTSGLAIIPLAGLIGRATDQLAIRVGPRLAGLQQLSPCVRPQGGSLGRRRGDAHPSLRCGAHLHAVHA